MADFDLTALQALASRANQSNVSSLNKDDVMKFTLQALGELDVASGVGSGVSTSSPLASMESAGVDQQLTVSTSAVPLAAFPALTTQLYVNVQDQAVRVTFDGSAPTTTNGHVFASGYQELWSVSLATAAQFIRDNGTDAVVHATPLK